MRESTYKLRLHESSLIVETNKLLYLVKKIYNFNRFNKLNEEKLHYSVLFLEKIHLQKSFNLVKINLKIYNTQ